jgi:hypothetical protein
VGQREGEGDERERRESEEARDGERVESEGRYKSVDEMATDLFGCLVRDPPCSCVCVLVVCVYLCVCTGPPSLLTTHTLSSIQRAEDCGVCVRERERERESVCVCVCAPASCKPPLARVTAHNRLCNWS